MNVVAVVKPLTIVGVHPTEELEHACVAHDPDILLDAMQDWIT